MFVMLVTVSCYCIMSSIVHITQHMMINHPRLNPILLASIAAPLIVGPLAAQTASVGPRIGHEFMPTARPAFSVLPASAAVDTTAHQYQPSYWVEGGVMAGVMLGATAGGFVYGFCDSDSNCQNRGAAAIVAGLGGAAIGFGVGALVGGVFPASHPRPLKGHPGKGLLVGTAAGALTTFGLVSQGCLDGCSGTEVGYDFLFTLISGTTGMLLGLGHPSEAQQ